jgi:uncharacterized metal-binding protein
MEIIESKEKKQEQVNDYFGLQGDEKEILVNSYETVSQTKASSSRLEEIKLFCKKMGYKKIGIAFCKGVREFGLKVDEYLSKDFETCSVCCNLNSIKKGELDVAFVKDSTELACNPIGQANIINNAEVDFTIKVGFCIGHDIIFSKRIKSPTTTLLVKDRKNKHKTYDTFS